MKIRVLRDTVVEGSVRWAGEVIDLPRPTPREYPGGLVDQLEANGVAERVNEEDYEDRMEKRYNLTPGPFPTREGEKIKDVMVFTPVYRLESATVEAILGGSPSTVLKDGLGTSPVRSAGLEWDGSITWILQRDNPLVVGDQAHSGEARKAGILNNLHQMQRARETFLAGRYEALLVVESDMIPPKDALIRLAAVGTDVAYGVYRFRTSDVINIFELYPGKPNNPGESLSLHPHLLRRAMKLGVYPCSGAGFGCTLIKRRVLERLEFRIDERDSVHADTYFCRDVLQAGFSQAAEMRVVCGHKDESGEVLWPELGSVMCQVSSVK